MSADFGDSPGVVNSGAAYIFQRSGTTWTEVSKLWASDAVASMRFGQNISMSGDGNTVLVGSIFQSESPTSRNGATYVFVREGSTWSEQQKLLASDRVDNAEFGVETALSYDGNTALIAAYRGDPGGTNEAGEGYIFTRSGTTWTESAILIASDKATFDRLGSGVALSADGTTAVLGARSADIGAAADEGAVYVFVKSGTSWAQQAKLVASDGADGNRMGVRVSVSADGNMALVGADLGDAKVTNAGQAYIWTRSGTTWTETDVLVGSDSVLSDSFGFSVALSAGKSTLLVGAFQHDGGGKLDGGTVYYYRQGAPNGTPCRLADDCQSGQCVDGVCCNSACGGGDTTDCQSCLGSQTGGADGTCGMIGSAASYVCRAANGACDQAERCSGASSACPADAFKSSGTSCRAALGVCDRAESCDGVSRDCPADVRQPRGFICKPAGSNATCDPPDYCDGVRTSCPANFTPYGTSCGAGQICSGTGRCL